MATLVRQCNSCPVCHLPLMYNFPVSDGHGAFEQNSDYWWYWMQTEMKSNISFNSSLFGTYANSCNIERCHYIAACMVPEITRPALFETPAVTGIFEPEDGMYLQPKMRRQESMHRLFRIDMKSLFPRGIPTYRLMRLNNFLSTMGTRWFLACKDCNGSHTSDNQLKAMVTQLYNLRQGRGEKVEPRSIYAMYTLVFDCMANYADTTFPHILVDQERCKYWQIELWLTICTIMFIAQHVKQRTNTKYNNMNLWKYTFHHAHRDMGLCDFYMSQILAIMLYGNNDIDVDFIWLHQKFLCTLPIWAQEEQLFITPVNSYRCLWRMVLGGSSDSSPWLPVMQDMGMSTENSTYSNISHEPYWINNQTSVAELGNHIGQRIHDFAKRWLEPIGKTIDARHRRYDDRAHIDLSDYPMPGRLAHPLISLKDRFEESCGVSLYRTLKTFHLQAVTLDRDTFVTELLAEHQSLHMVEAMFHSQFPIHYKFLLYHNFVCLAFHRMRVAYKITTLNTMAPSPDLRTIPTKWNRMTQYLQALLEALP